MKRFVAPLCGGGRGGGNVGSARFSVTVRQEGITRLFGWGVPRSPPPFLKNLIKKSGRKVSLWAFNRHHRNDWRREIGRPDGVQGPANCLPPRGWGGLTNWCCLKATACAFAKANP